MEQNTSLNLSGTHAQKQLLTTSRLASELLTFAHFLCPEESSASLIVERTLSLFFYKNKTRFNAELKLSNFNPNEYVFKKNDYFFLLQKIIYFYKRDFLLKMKHEPQNVFEKLNWRKRVVLVLSYKYKFGANDITSLLDISKSQFIEVLYAAKVDLELDFEETEFDRGDILFSNADNHYFYKKNLDIHSSLNTKEKDEHSRQILNVIPNYPVVMDNLYQVKKKILESLKQIEDNQL